MVSVQVPAIRAGRELHAAILGSAIDGATGHGGALLVVVVLT